MITSKLSRWARNLAAVSSAPLEFCPRFPEVAARWESWWQFQADRPLLIAPAAWDSGGYWGKAYHLLDDPEAWLLAVETQVAAAYYVAETLPRVRVDIGPVAPGAFFGAPLTLSEREQTAWQDPVLIDWSEAARIRFDPENEWFRRVRRLLETVANVPKVGISCARLT